MFWLIRSSHFINIRARRCGLVAALGFIGLRDVTIIRAEGLAIPGKKEPALEAALKEIAALTA
jgi:FMN-dependent NADH-azoreductase